MGRRIARESELEIEHLPYMQWSDWMSRLSKLKYAVHLMPTKAAGTFALNCARLGIPCIGYKGLDTQEICFPTTTVRDGDVQGAIKIMNSLQYDFDFRESAIEYARDAVDYFSEDAYITSMDNHFTYIYNKQEHN